MDLDRGAWPQRSDRAINGGKIVSNPIYELDNAELQCVSGGAHKLFEFLGLKVIYEENIPQGGTLYQACYGDSCVQWISK